MDKTAIKNYAVKARRDLISAVKQKWEYIEQDGENNLFLSSQGRKTLASLRKKIDAEGIDNVMENIAYTWFNRLIALRYMEINDYLPSGIRILSSVDKGRIEPDALRQVSSLDFVNSAKVAEIKADTALNANEKLYRYILIAQCNALSKILPGMFQKLDDYTELLLPDSLYSTGGIVHDLVNAIHEDNFSIEKQGQIEIIGWLYQYYTSEKKDEVFAALKKNVKITKDTIPAATQLFTPEWIVKYMVENSLGRLWLERHPNEDLRKSWLYYVDEAEQEPQVAEQLKAMREASPINSPQDLRFIDPCMGSGHILVYAFDVLFQIYKSEGHTDRDIPNLILKHNLHGLDIDDRAGQLAYFALMMKARAYNRRFFRQDNVPQPMVYSANNDPEISEFGSLIKVDELGEMPEMPKEYTIDNIDEVANHERNLLWWNYRRLLAQKYDVVVTNPPYLAPTPKQADWVKKNYPNSKSDLCVVFIERNFELIKQHGFVSMITMHSWMFLSSYEKFRESLISTKDIVNMVHLGARAFEEIGGEVVQTTAFVLGKINTSDYLATYVRLVDFVGQQVKEDVFLRGENRNTTKIQNFKKIPGMPVAYWLSKRAINAFSADNMLGKKQEVRGGLTTGDNERFLRYWHEVKLLDIAFGVSNIEDTIHLTFKWYPMAKGGSFRKWYGNNEYIVNWKENGAEIKHWVVNNPSDPHTTHWSRRLFNIDCYFKKIITWSGISSSEPSIRLCDNAIFGSGAKALLPSSNLAYYLAFLNSKVALNYLRVLSPTLNFESGHISSLPIIGESHDIVDDVTTQNIAISRTDWDSFETSWDFKRHPLVKQADDDDKTMYFCLKIGKERWIKAFKEGSACFSPVYDFIKQAEVTGNDEQGDLYEGVFARLKHTNPRIKEMENKLGDDLEIIPNGEYVLLRRKSCKDIPVFCIYGFYKSDFKPVGEVITNENGISRLDCRCDIHPKMYKNFIQSGDVRNDVDESICGFYCSAGHLFEEIEKSLNKEQTLFIKRKVNYDLWESDEFLIEPTDEYVELGYKANRFSYQNEARYILYNTHQNTKKVLPYTPIGGNSGNMANSEIYMIATVQVEKKPDILLSDKYSVWERECDERFNTLKANEKELNRIFIDIYGLQDELTPEVAEKDVTVRKADLGRDVRSFISYAVGCMFGRYSLDEPGLVFAGGTFDPTRYKTFKPVSDNIIPINHIDYFDTDIVLMFVEFVRAVYGDSTLGENLDFIANAIYPDANGTARERIRRYFLNDFYKDHLKIYQKRPIYWQMESGKKDGFKALFYLHRYDKYTMARARTDYLHPIQRKYDAEIKDLTQSIADDPSKKAAANKAITMLQGKMDECRAYDPVVAHIAYREIVLDLDDGVKVNYAKFQGVEVPKDDGTSEIMDLLGRI